LDRTLIWNPGHPRQILREYEIRRVPVQGQEAEIRVISNGTQTARVGVAATVRMPPGR
jgi:hypothetical protein